MCHGNSDFKFEKWSSMMIMMMSVCVFITAVPNTKLFVGPERNPVL